MAGTGLMLSPDELAALLSREEGPRIEFKLQFDFTGQYSSFERNEFAKDIMALANTAGRSNEDYSYLIIGARDKLESDCTRKLQDVGRGQYEQKSLLAIVNSKCRPQLPDLRYHEVAVKGTLLGVVTIPPSPYRHEVSMDFQDKARRWWHQGVVLVRRGESVGIAAPAELDQMERDKRAWLPAAVAQEDPWGGVRELLEREISFVDQECGRVSGKALQEVFVKRNFVEWETAPAGEPENERRAVTEPRSWAEVMAELHDRKAVVVLGDPGFGKTLSLLQEVQSRCQGALRALEQQPGGSADFSFGAYFHANDLAHALDPARETTECIVSLLAGRHRFGEKVKEFVRAKLQSGVLLVAVDALDEVSQDTEQVLRDALRELARARTPCELLLSARQVGYNESPMPFAGEWEILAFSRKQLQHAAYKWFYHSPQQSDQFADMVKNAPPFGELLTNPLLFMLACQVWEEACKKAAGNDESAPAFNRRCDLYERAVLRLRSRWLERVEDKPSELQKWAFIPFLEDLAWQLWSHDPRARLFTVGRLSEAIDNATKHQSLDGRLLLEDLRQSGVLTKIGKDDANSSYLFLHRTLLEFLAASHLARIAEDAQIPVVQSYFGDADSHVVLWMVAGKLRNPEPLIAAMVVWSQQQLELPREHSPATHSRVLGRLLADCLFECLPGGISDETRHRAWELITRGLDRAQRRARKGEWKDVDEWSLLFRVLRAVEVHEGALSRADDALNLARDIREAEGSERLGALSERLLASAYRSPCPAVRWVAVWATGAIHCRGDGVIAAKFAGKVVELLTTDDSPHVRCLAARALVEVEQPNAFNILRGILDGECRTTAVGAAIGLSRLRTDAALSILVAKARPLLCEYAAHRDPLPIAVVGALEDIVANARRENLGGVLGDRNLADVFKAALNYPDPLLMGTAASALGKMEFGTSWNLVKELVELSDNSGDNDMRIMRASAAFACDLLCLKIDEATFPEALDLFQKWLRNLNEIPEVRRPASSGLVKIARRGHTSEVMIPVLLSGAQDKDSKVAKNCLIALVSFRHQAVLDDLIVLMGQFDGRRRKLVGEVAGVAPTLASMTLLLWLLENEKRAEVLLTALFAIQQICEKVLRGSRLLVGFPDYVRDLKLFRSLAERCLEFLGTEAPAVVVSTSLASLQQLVRLPPFLKGPLNSMREQTPIHARLMLRHTDPDVRATACSALGATGNQGDIPLIEELSGTEQSEKVRQSCRAAVRFIKRRLASQH